jgi:hypothetical protein
MLKITSTTERHGKSTDHLGITYNIKVRCTWINSSELNFYKDYGALHL